MALRLCPWPLALTVREGPAGYREGGHPAGLN